MEAATAEVGTGVAVSEGGALEKHRAALPDVDRLMEMAVEKGMEGVEALERLVELRLRLLDIEAASALNDAVAAFRRECPQINKGREAKIVTKSGGEFGFRYASLDDIQDVIDPVLQANGLSYTWDSKTAGGQLSCTCILRHIAGASLTATFECPTETGGSMSAAQRTGAALTYAQRQSLKQALGLKVSDIDDDGLPPREAERVTDEQLANLEAVWDEVSANVDTNKFFEFFGCETLAAMPTDRYEEALRMLERKR